MALVLGWVDGAFFAGFDGSADDHEAVEGVEPEGCAEGEGEGGDEPTGEGLKEDAEVEPRGGAEGGPVLGQGAVPADGKGEAGADVVEGVDGGAEFLAGVVGGVAGWERSSRGVLDIGAGGVGEGLAEGGFDPERAADADGVDVEEDGEEHGDDEEDVLDVLLVPAGDAVHGVVVPVFERGLEGVDVVFGAESEGFDGDVSFAVAGSVVEGLADAAHEFPTGGALAVEEIDEGDGEGAGGDVGGEEERVGGGLVRGWRGDAGDADDGLEPEAEAAEGAAAEPGEIDGGIAVEAGDEAVAVDALDEVGVAGEEASDAVVEVGGTGLDEGGEELLDGGGDEAEKEVDEGHAEGDVEDGRAEHRAAYFRWSGIATVGYQAFGGRVRQSRLRRVRCGDDQTNQSSDDDDADDH